MTRRAARAALRFLFDWRTGATLCATAVVALVIVVVVVGGQTTHDALEARNRTSAAATRRIDKLNARIDSLVAEMATTRQDVGRRGAEIAALQEQVRQLGGRPVVPTTTTTVEQVTPTTVPSTSTTSTTAPSRHERCVLVVCLAG